MTAAESEETISSPRLALAMLGAIVLLGVLGRGLQLISIGGHLNVALGTGIVLIVSSFLLATAGRWAKWFFAACCLFTVRAGMSVLLGRTISVPSMAAPRSLFAELSVIFAVMCFLSYRFVSAKPNWVDSVCLVGAVIAFVFWMLTGGAIRWMLPSVVLLGMAFAYTKFVRHGHFQKAAGAK